MFNCVKKKDRGESTSPDQIDELFDAPTARPSRIALIPGHTKTSQGMETYNNIREFDWNNKLVDAILKEGEVKPIRLIKYLRQSGSYSAANKALVKQMKKDNIHLAIEFHINAAGIPEARGCEMLIKNGADSTAKRAAYIMASFSDAFAILRRRQYKGARGVMGLNSGDRGSGFLFEAEKNGISAMIFEPFFGDYKTPDSGQFLSEDDFGIEKMAKFWIKIISRL